MEAKATNHRDTGKRSLTEVSLSDIGTCMNLSPAWCGMTRVRLRQAGNKNVPATVERSFMARSSA